MTARRPRSPRSGHLRPQPEDRLRAHLNGPTLRRGAKPKEADNAGDSVIVEGRYTGTFKESGKNLDAQYCHVFTMRDGKLVNFQQFVDTAQLQEVMGVS